MNIIRKCECMVFFKEDTNEMEQFFFTTKEVDFDTCELNNFTGRRYVPKLIGFNMKTNQSFHLHSWWVNRVATNEERDKCFQWMEEKGIKFNPNTLEYTRIWV